MIWELHRWYFGAKFYVDEDTDRNFFSSSNRMFHLHKRKKLVVKVIKVFLLKVRYFSQMFPIKTACALPYYQRYALMYVFQWYLFAFFFYFIFVKQAKFKQLKHNIFQSVIRIYKPNRNTWAAMILFVSKKSVKVWLQLQADPLIH